MRRGKVLHITRGAVAPGQLCRNLPLPLRVPAQEALEPVNLESLLSSTKQPRPCQYCSDTVGLFFCGTGVEPRTFTSH